MDFLDFLRHADIPIIQKPRHEASLLSGIQAVAPVLITIQPFHVARGPHLGQLAVLGLRLSGRDALDDIINERVLIRSVRTDQQIPLHLHRLQPDQRLFQTSCHALQNGIHRIIRIISILA